MNNFFSRRICLVLFFPVALLGSGCSGSKGTAPKDQVTGKVTLKGGKAVAGIVVFVYPDGTETSAPTGDEGTYTIPKPTPGTVKVLVKAMPGASPGLRPPKDADPTKDAGVSVSGPSGVPPPAKYGLPASSNLTYEVKPGQQTFNIDLAP